MNKIKIFISQPMNGLSKGSILAERQRIIKTAYSTYGDNVEILDTFFDDEKLSPIQCLAKSISLLATADVAFFAVGWDAYRGCQIEYKICYEYGIKTHISV